MGNIVFFVDLKAINRGKDDKRGYLKFYFGIASLFKFNSDILFAKVLLFHVQFWVTTVCFTCKTSIDNSKVILTGIFEKVSLTTVISNQVVYFVTCDFHVIRNITIGNFYRFIISTNSLAFSQCTTKDTIGDCYSLTSLPNRSEG